MQNNKFAIVSGMSLGLAAMLAQSVNAPPPVGTRAPVTVASLSETARRRRYITTPRAALADLERRRHNAAIDAKKAAKAERRAQARDANRAARKGAR